jgi:ribosomal protein S18 acetylase RimI-like enzyme
MSSYRTRRAISATPYFPVSKVAVLPGARRRGLGEAMVRAVVAAAGNRRGAGVVVRLRVEATNHSALGAVRVETRVESAWFLRLKL